ncbi:phage holin family protein [Nonlabens marinus]|nr:phage holin family protein [Nonlabens marinus]
MSKSIKENFEDLSLTAQNYIESSIAYYRLDFFKKSMKVAIDSSHKLILAFFLLIALLFLSVALSIYLGDLVGNLALGYIIVGLFYIVITLLCAAFLKPVLRKIILRRASISYFNDDSKRSVEEVVNTAPTTKTDTKDEEFESLH